MDDFKKYVSVSAAIIVGSFVVVAAAVWWSTNDLVERATAIVEKRATIREQARLVEVLAAFKEIAPKVQSYEAKFAELVPPKDRLLDFPRWIEQLARLNQISTTFAFQGDPNTPAPPELGYADFQLTASGAAANLIEFFGQLELEAPRFLIRLRHYEITKTNGEYQVKTAGEVFFR